MKRFQGVYVVLVTPLDQAGHVNVPGIKRNVEWLVEEGVDGVVALGSTGEFASLDAQSKTRVMRAVVDAASGRVPVLVGVGAETTEQTIVNLQEAERENADGALVICPWYYSPTSDELVDHFERVAGATSLPVMIYNNPFTSKVDIKPDTLAVLAQHENIVAVKESSGDIRRIAEIRLRTRDQLDIFCGWEDMAYESFLMGACGWICVAANVIPRACQQLYRLLASGEPTPEAWKLYGTLLPFLRYLEYRGRTQQALKYALDRMGLSGGRSTSPKRPLSANEEAEVEALLNPLGVSFETSREAPDGNRFA